jgi:O-antigen ligase
MGLLGFALLMLLLLWLAATDVPRFCVATLLLAGIPMTLFTGDRLLSGALDSNTQSIYMFVVASGTALALILQLNELQDELHRRTMLVVLICYAVGSLAWAGSMVYGIRMLAKLSCPLLFLVLSSIAVRQGLTERRIQNAICAAGVISLSLAIINYASGGIIAPRLESPGLLGLTEVSAPFTSPADFSFTLSGALFVAYGAWNARRSPWMLAIVIAMAVGLLLALCRAAIAGAVLGLIVFHVAGRRVKIYQSVIAVAVIVLGAVILANTESFKTRMFFDPEHVSWSMLVTDRETFLANIDTSGRDELWSEALHDFRDESATFGGGIGSVDRWIRDRYVRGAELHSDVFRLYLDLGVIGLLLFVAAISSFVFRLISTVRATNAVGGGQASAPRIALAALACYCLTLFTDNTLNYVTQFGVWVFCLAGAASSSEPGEVSTAEARPMGQERPRAFQNVID